MKVARSKRLETVLKDPQASKQLREFLASATIGNSSQEIQTTDSKGKSIGYFAKLIPIDGKEK
ncbi:hypothetical protein [Chromobacterium sphagni]|uniref:hypothetical protein n=1 Tax=Chromobacterium sphagni TaxID=1903179 RepID=UPI0011144196|nr:hypothetical protein [Chromobacterium sphagni]